MSNIALTERRNWIGGTEVAALLGKSSRKTAFEVWHIKAGNISGDGMLGDRGEAGKFMESAIAAWAADKWNLRLRKVRRHIRHKTIERFGVSLDYETVEGHIPYEIKNVDNLVFRDNWEHDGDTITRTPIDYLLQCQAQLACTGKPRHGLVACVGGNSLYRMEIARHDRVVAKIENAVRRFWQSIDEGKEPKPNFAADAAAISQLYWRSDEGSVDYSSNNRLHCVLAEYEDARAREKAAGEQKDQAKAEVLTIINGHSKVVCGDYVLNTSTVREADISFKRKPYRAFRLDRTDEEESVDA